MKQYHATRDSGYEHHAADPEYDEPAQWNCSIRDEQDNVVATAHDETLEGAGALAVRIAELLNSDTTEEA